MKTGLFAAAFAALLLLSPHGDAAGYYTLPHSKVQVGRCIDEVRTHYGDDILRMEQHTTDAGTTVLFHVGRLERGEWIVVCSGRSGQIVKAQWVRGNALGTDN